MLHLIRLVCSAIVILSIAASAAAQTGGGFVEAGVLADYNPTLRADQETAAGVTGSFGVFISSRWSLRLEIDRPNWHGTHRRSETRVADHIEAYDLQEDGRSPSLSFLVGRDFRSSSRVRASLVIGLTPTQRQFRTNGWTERRDLQGNVTQHTEISRVSRNYTWWAATAGADITIAMTDRLLLTPQVRLHTYGGLSEHTSQVFVRSRFLVRWQF